MVNMLFHEKRSDEDMLYDLAKKLIKKYALKKNNILGFSLEDSYTDLLFNLSLIKTLKELTGAIIILGGDFKYSRDFYEKYPFVDFIIRGCGILSLKMLLFCLEGKGVFEDVPGLFYRKGQRIFANPYLRQAGSVDIIPDFADLDMEDYDFGLSDFKPPEFPEDKLKEIYRPDFKIRCLPYQFIKGCPHSCVYCYWSRERLFKITSPKKVVDNLQFMKKKYKVNHFIFLNNAINPTLSYAEELMDAFKKRSLNISWSDSVHPAMMNKDLFPALKESGCKKLFYGIESASPRSLKAMNRTGKVSEYLRNLRESHKHGIFNGINILVGIPFEQFEDIQLTYEFLQRSKPYFETYNVNMLKVIPEWGLTKNPEEMGIILKDFGNTKLRNPSNDLSVRRLLHKEVGFNKWSGFYSFDEVGGLKWEEKNIQDITHARYLLNSLDKNKKGFFDNALFVYYLNYIFDSKKEALDWYSKNKS